jgi:hypothetical protein
MDKDETFTITSINNTNSTDTITLSDLSSTFNWQLPPLSTDQITTLQPSSPTITFPQIAPLSTGGGRILTSTGYDYNWNVSSTNPNSLEVRGDANFQGDVKIKGKSIADSLEKIEEKLAILRPNEQLEEKWEKLRELRNQYIELEKDILEKEKIWETLKK